MNSSNMLHNIVIKHVTLRDIIFALKEVWNADTHFVHNEWQNDTA